MGRLLTTEEVAAMLQVPAATVKYWRAQRVGPLGFRVGREIRYDQADVEDWLREKREEAAAAGGRA